ncbi:MAG: hypothetical protein NT042_08500 [Sulfuritalea sp.]|nr:hypothetical protein [Sulfuritalea sp.]
MDHPRTPEDRPHCLSRNFSDDHEMLRTGMVAYDALYAWCAK